MPKILVVISRYYQSIADEMEIGATSVIQASGCEFEVLEVPGAFEIPAAIRMAAETGKYDGYVALGCVIRGETTHYDYVCRESARGLNQLAINYMLPIGYGILTCENMDQAKVRANISEGNKGGDAARACIHMMTLKEHFSIGKITA
jgi:6,7-dimethyl-8-ribityllumazine synthase